LGFVDGRYARFAQFLRGPFAALGHFGDMVRGREHRYLGHNPAGAVMIVALLVTLAGMAFTGWLMEDPAPSAMLPDLSRIVAHADEDGERTEAEGPLKEVHETLANLTLLLVALHVGGVALASSGEPRPRHGHRLQASSGTG
jgi:cytochrome b